MLKFCNNGHQMEESWEICPYCQRTGFQNAGGSPGAAKTRLESDQHPAPPVQSVPLAQHVPLAVAPLPGSIRKIVLLTERPQTSLAGWLVAMNGDQKGEDFRIREGQNSLGSSPGNDIVIHDPAVSGKHAIIRYKDQKFSITDLDSTNGTFVNASPDAISREDLHDNDMIRVGSVSLKFKSL